MLVKLRWIISHNGTRNKACSFRPSSPTTESTGLGMTRRETTPRNVRHGRSSGRVSCAPQPALGTRYHFYSTKSTQTVRCKPAFADTPTRTRGGDTPIPQGNATPIGEMTCSEAAVNQLTKARDTPTDAVPAPLGLPLSRPTTVRWHQLWGDGSELGKAALDDPFLSSGS